MTWNAPSAQISIVPLPVNAKITSISSSRSQELEKRKPHPKSNKPLTVKQCFLFSGLHKLCHSNLFTYGVSCSRLKPCFAVCARNIKENAAHIDDSNGGGCNVKGKQRPAAFAIVCFCFCEFHTVSYSRICGEQVADVVQSMMVFVLPLSVKRMISKLYIQQRNVNG